MTARKKDGTINLLLFPALRLVKLLLQRAAAPSPYPSATDSSQTSAKVSTCSWLDHVLSSLKIKTKGVFHPRFLYAFKNNFS